eukprot:gnl/Dysnectes_brevis/1810_a2073_1497.p1 GENE.gnl/Dysnectes_brevis/1810_a2073_1497~~gnl/Dysnectes_brevis/1810_a2073_1497.p1  ORF type:complete len:306 (+),score=58.85 gnl/Dysnectes_brevis/1810_a2073_1497:48-920(+)
MSSSDNCFIGYGDSTLHIYTFLVIITTFITICCIFFIISSFRDKELRCHQPQYLILSLIGSIVVNWFFLYEAQTFPNETSTYSFAVYYIGFAITIIPLILTTWRIIVIYTPTPSLQWPPCPPIRMISNLTYQRVGTWWMIKRLMILIIPDVIGSIAVGFLTFLEARAEGDEKELLRSQIIAADDLTVKYNVVLAVMLFAICVWYSLISSRTVSVVPNLWRLLLINIELLAMIMFDNIIWIQIQGDCTEPPKCGLFVIELYVSTFILMLLSLTMVFVRYRKKKTYHSRTEV